VRRHGAENVVRIDVNALRRCLQEAPGIAPEAAHPSREEAGWSVYAEAPAAEAAAAARGPRGAAAAAAAQPPPLFHAFAHPSAREVPVPAVLEARDEGIARPASYCAAGSGLRTYRFALAAVEPETGRLWYVRDAEVDVKLRSAWGAARAELANRVIARIMLGTGGGAGLGGAAGAGRAGAGGRAGSAARGQSALGRGASTAGASASRAALSAYGGAAPGGYASRGGHRGGEAGDGDGDSELEEEGEEGAAARLAARHAQVRASVGRTGGTSADAKPRKRSGSTAAGRAGRRRRHDEEADGGEAYAEGDVDARARGDDYWDGGGLMAQQEGRHTKPRQGAPDGSDGGDAVSRGGASRATAGATATAGGGKALREKQVAADGWIG
jgi:hypothetical protein